MNSAGITRKTCPLAVISLLLSFSTLFTLLLGGAISIALAIISLYRIHKYKRTLKGASFAVAGIAISLFCIAIFLLWTIDAPPTRPDYTIADLRSAPLRYAETYDLLMILADQEQTTTEAREDIPTVPPLGLSKPDIKLIGEISELLEDADREKISDLIRADANAINQAWTNAKNARDIVTALTQFEEIADLNQLNLDLQGPSSHLITLARLYEVHIHLSVEQGDIPEAVHQLIEVDSFFRKLNLNARGLLTKMFCLVGLKKSLTTANLVINNAKSDAQSLNSLAEHFTPLTGEDLSIRNACIGDYLFFKNVLDTEFRRHLGYRNPMLKRNSTLRVYRNSCDSAIAYLSESREDKRQPYTVWPSIYPDWLPHVSIPGEPLPWDCWFYKAYNPLGCLFITIVTPNFSSLVKLEKRLKITDDLLQIVLNKRLGKDLDLKARAYSDEYIIDFDKKIIFSPGLDGKPHTRDDIKLIINPDVLNLKD